MYNQALTNHLQQLTTQWLSSASTIHTKDLNNLHIEELRNVLRFHEYRYYVQNDPLISDFEYDTLYKLLEKFEKENPALITPDSPTQRVGSRLGERFSQSGTPGSDAVS